MPIREYTCKSCGAEFEFYELSNDPEKPKCKLCDSEHVERLVSAFGGYQGSMGGGSTTPRQAGSFKGRKKK